VKKRKIRILATNDDCIDLHLKSTYEAIRREEYFMSDVDRITVIHGLNQEKIEGVINVSYEII